MQKSGAASPVVRIGRTVSKSEREGVPAVMSLASVATVGASNRLRIATSTSSAARMRPISRVASSEWPPSSKKLSSMPTSATPSVSANSAHSTASCGVRGSRRAALAATTGAGSARRSSLPFGVSGSRSSMTNADGTM